MLSVSGLWQYRHRSGQPFRKTVRRVPGPSTAVTSSQEWTEPSSPVRIIASLSLRSRSSATATPSSPAPVRRRGAVGTSRSTGMDSPKSSAAPETSGTPTTDGAPRKTPRPAPPPRGRVAAPVAELVEVMRTRFLETVSHGAVERPAQHVELLLAGEADEVHGVAGDADRQLRVVLGVLHGVLEGLADQHVDVHVVPLGTDRGVEQAGQVGDLLLLRAAE